MDLYDKIKNIYGLNNEDGLIKAVTFTKKILSDLVEERMCKVYSSYLLEELKKQHIPAHMINTLDLGFQYEHVFVLIPSNDDGYFLADLTFSQFNKNINTLSQLLNEGYQLINDNSFRDYLSIVLNEDITEQISINDIFYSSNVIGNDLHQFKR